MFKKKAQKIRDQILLESTISQFTEHLNDLEVYDIVFSGEQSKIYDPSVVSSQHNEFSHYVHAHKKSCDRYGCSELNDFWGELDIAWEEFVSAVCTQIKNIKSCIRELKFELKLRISIFEFDKRKTLRSIFHFSFKILDDEHAIDCLTFIIVNQINHFKFNLNEIKRSINRPRGNYSIQQHN